MSDGNGALPDGWEATTFGELFDFKGGSQPPKKEFVDEPRDGYVRLLQIRDFASDQFPVYINDADRWPKCDEDDVMIARYGASLGRVLTGMAGAYNVALIKMIFDRENIDTGWARYFLMSNHFQGPIHLLSRSAQNGFNKKEVAPIEVQLPPLAEQRRIVSKIESLQERSSRARRALSEVGPLLEQFRQSVLRAAFSGRLTADWRAAHRDVEPATELAVVSSLVKTKKAEIAQGHETVRGLAPEEWPIAKLGNLFTFIDYRGKNPKKAKSGLRLITAKNIRMGHLKDEPIEFVSEETYASWMTRGFPQKGDIFFVTEGHTMGFVAINNRDDDFALAQRTITLQPPDGVDSRCFFYFLMSPTMQSLVELNATGSAAKGVKGAKLRDFPIPFPCKAEQTEIARRVEELFEILVGIEVTTSESESALTRLDQSILAKAFRGELVPQDPRDEPASELLARIHKSRNAEAAAKRKLRK